ncbi:zinc finger protein 3 homolog [Hetaerina americana]|uniref:zinc finger protein 3 homolog n=1 Tax=Hetaerina americana TaxID=62018 RepID=UPI003A7F2DD0
MDPMNRYDLCRLCLQNSQSLVDIFEKNVEHGFIIKDAIEDLMQFQVSQVKGIPWMACSRCLVKLNDFRLFKIQCIDSKMAFETKFSRSDLLGGDSERCHTTFDSKFARNCLEDVQHHASVLDSFGVRLDLPENHIRQELYPEVILKTMDENDAIDDTASSSCHYPVVDSSSSSYVNSTKGCEMPTSKASNCTQGVRKRIRQPRRKKAGNQMEVPSYLSSEIDITRVRVELRRQLEAEPENHKQQSKEDQSQLMPSDCLNSALEPSVSLEDWNGRLCGDGARHGTLDDSTGMAVGGVCSGSEVGDVLSASLVGELLAEAETKPYVCEFCNKVYGTRSELVRHSKTHSGERPYLCDICGFSFARRYHLVQHKMIHTGEKPFRCEDCDKCFSKSSHLNRHRRTHTGERPYSCLVCGKSFSLNYNLNAHMKVHQQEGEEQDLPCPHCNKTFTYKHNLVQHLKRHDATQIEVQQPQRQHTCHECDMTFASKGDLARHTSEHSIERPYCCIECLACFADEVELARHSARHHGTNVPHACDICNQMFALESDLAKHRLAHRSAGPKRFACVDCDKSFNRRSRLLRHIASVHARHGIGGGTVPFAASSLRLAT